MIRFLFTSLIIISTHLESHSNSVILEKNKVVTEDLDDNPLLTNVLKQLNLKKEYIYQNLYTEKTLPYSKSLTVMVIPKFTIKKLNNDEYLELDAYIIVANNQTGKIVHKFIEPKSWTSDAVALSSIDIDTAPYYLTQNLRGFGIYVNYIGGSRPNPYNLTEFSLFVPKGGLLNRILKNYPISEYHGEWDMECEGEFELSKSTIAIDKKQTNGLYNIKLNQTIIVTENIPKNDDCKEKKTVKHKTIRLKYNGKEYK
jgi:hypothetical protein